MTARCPLRVLPLGVTGTVTDAAGAAVSGATVTLTSEGTNASITTQTSDGGSYVFDLIQPGNYTVTIEKQGFKKFISTNNALLVNQPSTVNAALEIGDVSASVSGAGIGGTGADIYVGQCRYDNRAEDAGSASDHRAPRT